MVTGFATAVTVSAGISRGQLNHPPGPLARFGAVYFDELNAVTLDGPRVLPNGVATTMVNNGGSILAQPVRPADFAFKVVYNMS